MGRWIQKLAHFKKLETTHTQHNGTFHKNGTTMEESNTTNLPSADYVDLHELAKGWKAAIARAKDPATRYA